LALDPGRRITRTNLLIAEAALAAQSGDLELAIAKAREAVSRDPYYRKTLATYLNNRGVALKDYGAKIDHYREALKYSPNDKIVQDNLASAIAQRDAARKEAEARVEIGRSIGKLVESLQPGADKKAGPGPGQPGELQFMGESGVEAGRVPGRKGNVFFGTGGNPDGLEFMPASPEAGVKSKTAGQQLDGADKSGKLALAAETPEEMKALADCQFSKAGCVKGQPLATLELKGVPRGAARLPEAVHKQMLGSSLGKQLIEAEKKARSEEAAAKKKLDDIEKSLSAASGAEQQKLAVQRAEAFQTWSNKTSEANTAAVAVEEEARKSYKFEIVEVPSPQPPPPAAK
jgi:tetratricopeptide (TPR) repeat protein